MASYANLKGFPVQVKYYPRQAVWEMTLRCNMNCMHCGSKAGTAREKELSTEECLNIADQLIGMGCEFITLIGGEIFLKKDWEKIARRFVDNGVYTNIITNAYNLGDEQYRQLEESGIRQVGISVDGMEAVHNKIRRNPNSFENVLSTMDKLREKGYSIAAITTLSDLNFDCLDEMYDLFLDKDVKIWQLQIVSPMGNARNNREVLLSCEKVPQITRFIKEKNAENKMKLVAGDNIGYFDENENYIRGDEGCFSGCKAGMYVVGLDSIGRVRGCESLQADEFIEGSLRQNTLEEIWNRDGAFSYNRDFSKDKLAGKCSSCDKAYLCKGGCRQLSNFTSGNKYESLYCCYI